MFKYRFRVVNIKFCNDTQLQILAYFKFIIFIVNT